MSNYVRDAVLVWTMVLVAAGLVAFLVVGTSGEDGATSGEGRTTPPPVETAPPAGKGGPRITVRMVPSIRFDTEEVILPANQQVTVRADNQDTTIFHNWAAYTDSSATEVIAKTDICTAPCAEEVTFTAPPPGEYFFRCDVHPTQMVGKLIVQ